MLLAFYVYEFNLRNILTADGERNNNKNTIVLFIEQPSLRLHKNLTHANILYLMSQGNSTKCYIQSLMRNEKYFGYIEVLNIYSNTLIIWKHLRGTIYSKTVVYLKLRKGWNREHSIWRPLARAEVIFFQTIMLVDK